MALKPLRWHAYLTGGEYIGPAFSLRTAEDAILKYDAVTKPFEPIGTIYEEISPGVMRVFKTYYRQAYPRGPARFGPEHAAQARRLKEWLKHSPVVEEEGPPDNDGSMEDWEDES